MDLDVEHRRERKPNFGRLRAKEFLKKNGPRSTAGTWRSLPIMRLTASLPPPPMPSTFILAVSTSANEHRTATWRGEEGGRRRRARERGREGAVAGGGGGEVEG